jgi:hypothetical protein
MIQLNQLHDATLAKIEFDWEIAELLFDFETCISGTPRVQILAFQVSNFICPRKHPWGPSVSVNEIKSEQKGESTFLLMEMQSGDVFEVICKEYSLKY